MANSANGKRNGRPTGAAKASSTSARPTVTSARSVTNGARVGAATSTTKGASSSTTKSAADSSSRLAGIRARSGQTPGQRKSIQSRKIQQRPWYLGSGGIYAAVAVVVVAILVFLLVRSGAGVDQYYTPVSATVFKEVTQVDPLTLDKIGAGSLTQPLVAAPANTPVNKDSSGKPIVLYMGAEYCPYCAGERWGMIIALSRFGTFSNLHNMVSSDTESGNLASLPTFTFRGSTYTSQYLTLQTVELNDRYENTLETGTTQQNNFLNTYDNPPYVASGDGGGIPFVSFANQYFAHSAGYTVTVLSGSTRDAIAAGLNDPNNLVTQSIEADANFITAGICKITNNLPASVCVTDPSSTVKNPIPALIKTLPPQQ